MALLLYRKRGPPVHPQNAAKIRSEGRRAPVKNDRDAPAVKPRAPS
jgi:hypothetical protein